MKRFDRETSTVQQLLSRLQQFSGAALLVPSSIQLHVECTATSSTVVHDRTKKMRPERCEIIGIRKQKQSEEQTNNDVQAVDYITPIKRVHRS